MQVDSIKTRVESALFQRLRLECDEPLSNVAFNFNLRRYTLAGPLPKNWVPQSDPVTGKVFYLNLRSGELHREHPVLKPILPQLRADKAAAEARFERDVAAPAREYATRLREAGGVIENKHSTDVECPPLSAHVHEHSVGVSPIF